MQINTWKRVYMKNEPWHIFFFLFFYRCHFNRPKFLIWSRGGRKVQGKRSKPRGQWWWSRSAKATPVPIESACFERKEKNSVYRRSWDPGRELFPHWNAPIWCFLGRARSAAAVTPPALRILAFSRLKLVSRKRNLEVVRFWVGFEWDFAVSCLKSGVRIGFDAKKSRLYWEF